MIIHPFSEIKYFRHYKYSQNHLDKGFMFLYFYSLKYLYFYIYNIFHTQIKINIYIKVVTITRIKSFTSRKCYIYKRGGI